ncbi:MAG: cell division protein FtsZ, partial [Muribaculaceae bacterium]|nr:cell division protein FtsZ [Muribaculaceae bacterium]
IAARSISELITKVGRINLDFKDVNTTLRKGGAAIISSGYGEGENRVTKAIKDALNSPLLKNRDVYSAQRILINTYISPNAQDQLKMSEMNELRQFMCNFDQSLDVIFGQAYDDTLDDRVKITVLAAGFNVTNSIIREAGAFDNIPIPAKEEPKVDDSDDQKRLLEEYGIKIREEQLQKAAARYLVLNTEDIENDDIIDLLEKTPTYGRGDKFKETISNLRATAQQGESKAAEHSTTPTISFGD